MKSPFGLKTMSKGQAFHSSNHHKWLSYQILGGKTVQNVQIDPQTTEIWPKQLIVTSTE